MFLGRQSSLHFEFSIGVEIVNLRCIHVSGLILFK